MASPDRIKIGAYLTDSENEALKRVADSLGVSASKAVAMAVKAMDEKIHKGGKVSLPVATSTGDKVASPVTPDIASLIKREIEAAVSFAVPRAIAALKTELLETIHPSEPLDRLDPVDAAPINYFPELDNETAGPKKRRTSKVKDKSIPLKAAAAGIPAELLKGLTQAELARRLGVSESTLRRAWIRDHRAEPRPEHFAKWSKEKDPDGIAWVRRDRFHFPIVG